MGSIWYSFHFIVCREGCLTLSIYWRKFVVLKSWFCFIPRRDSAKQIPKEVQLFLLVSYFVLGNVYWTFNLQTVFFLFETLRMFYPPKGRLLADSSRVPIIFTYVLFCLRKRLLDFQFTFGFLLFETFKMFYPPKGLCKANTEGGPIVFTYVLFWFRTRILDFQFRGGILPFWKLENVLSPEGMSACRLI